jgi:hypothetical protein
MVDLETLGTKSNSIIVSIGAVQFDIETGEIFEKFYTEINPKDCEKVGLKYSQATIDWWLKTNPDEYLKICNRGEPLLVALSYFRGWFGNLNLSPVYVWGNSNRFDLGLLENALNAIGMESFWSFRYELDVRTLVWFHPEIKEAEATVGMEHNALDDCIYQINYCSKIYQLIKKL